MIANGIYACCDDRRKAAVLGNPTLNGIDYLEVLDHDAIPLGIAALHHRGQCCLHLSLRENFRLLAQPRHDTTLRV